MSKNLVKNQNNTHNIHRSQTNGSIVTVICGEQYELYNIKRFYQLNPIVLMLYGLFRKRQDYDK